MLLLRYPLCPRDLPEIIMYILGDIGNSETKVYLVNSKNNSILKHINFSSITVQQIIKEKSGWT